MSDPVPGIFVQGFHGIYAAHWTVWDEADYRLIVDTSEQMGEEVRIGLIEQRHGDPLLGRPDPTVTGFMVPRKNWEELIRTMKEDS